MPEPLEHLPGLVGTNCRFGRFPPSEYSIPINVVACAVGGAVAGALGTYSNAAWGGLVVLPVTSGISYLIALVAGVAVHAILVKILKADFVEKTDDVEDDDVDIEFEF